MSKTYKSGVDLSEIYNARYINKPTKFAESVISGFIGSKIKYSATYSGDHLMLAYSADDEKKAQDIWRKAESDSAEYIERLRTESGSTDEFLALIPEVAEILGISVSSLKNRPLEIQLNLAQTYVNLWFSDDITIRNGLQQIEQLSFNAQNETEQVVAQKHSENNTPEKRRGIHEAAVRSEQAAIQERIEFEQQRSMVMQEENRTATNFNMAAFRREVERVRQRNSKNPAPTIENEERNLNGQ